ncbi:MAG: hypothetical protein R3343_08635 [Nitriliruptorales bacterium]|nr:hypothetical protein [Nitriliruptorales bacterium]
MHLPRLFDGPPPTLPRILDELSERWWSLTPRVRFAAAGAVTAVILLLASSVTDAEPTVPVLVAATDLQPGAAITSTDVHPAQRPASTVPPAAVAELPADARAVSAIPRGAVLTTLHLARDGLAAAVEPGRVAVAVPRETLPAAIAVGQRVDLLSGTPDGRGDVLASAARVLGGDGDHTWFEVSRAEAARVAAASSWGSIGVSVLAPDGRTRHDQ